MEIYIIAISLIVVIVVVTGIIIVSVKSNKTFSGIPAQNAGNVDIRKAVAERLGKISSAKVPDADVPRQENSAWQRVKAKYGQYISGGSGLLDGEAYPKVRLHVFYPDRMTAERVERKVSDAIASKLQPISEGMHDTNGTLKYNVVNEATLTGAQIKEYLVTVVNGGGEIWEALI